MSVAIDFQDRTRFLINILAPSFVIFHFFCHHDGSGTGLEAEVEARDGCGYGGVGGAEGLGREQYEIIWQILGEILEKHG